MKPENAAKLTDALKQVEGEPLVLRQAKVVSLEEDSVTVEWDGDVLSGIKYINRPGAGESVWGLENGPDRLVLGALDGGLKKGMITLWSGAIQDVPVGWALCDGSNGTPDLTERFVLGAGGEHDVGDTGGTAAATMPQHNHGAAGDHVHTLRYVVVASGSGANVYSPSVGGTQSTTGVGGSGDHTHTTQGTADDKANYPPFYALAYIMKL